jgi:hypothetical protein
MVKFAIQENTLLGPKDYQWYHTAYRFFRSEVGFFGNRRGKMDIWGLFAGGARKQPPYISPITADPKEPEVAC